MAAADGATGRVRVIIVDHDGGDMTLACLRSILATDWPPDRLEVVMVDNGSGAVARRVAHQLPSVRVVAAGANLGFGGGANLALGDLGGFDHVALVNNDAEVDPGWLKPLVEALATQPDVGAVNPKVLFTGSFVDVEVGSAAGPRGWLDRRALGVRVSGATVEGADAWPRLQAVSGFWGLEHGPDGPFLWTDGRGHLRVPGAGPAGRCLLRLAADGDRAVTLASGAARAEHHVGPEPRWCDVALAGRPLDVVNSAGGRLLRGGYGADRGYLEPDDGRYDRVEEVFSWTGSAVVLSRRYLEAVGTFEPSFFLYYEDLDLSWRGRAEGWRYLCVPASVVRHLHAASSVAGSALSHHHDARNRLLTLTRNAPGSMAATEVARFVGATASYARRDLLAPLLGGREPAPEEVRRRAVALGSYLGMLPAAVAARRRLGPRGRLTTEELSRWMAEP